MLSLATSGVWYCSGECLALALLQELLMALRANDVDGTKDWLALGVRLYLVRGIVH